MLIRFSGSASKTWERVTSIFSDYLWKFVQRPAAAIEMPRSKRRHHSRSRSRSSGGYREKRPKRHLDSPAGDESDSKRSNVR
ncbi:hypothetical protein quinque_014937 [Culex quinquefasciatus]